LIDILEIMFKGCQKRALEHFRSYIKDVSNIVEISPEDVDKNKERNSKQT
jgi:hypothetical protein